MRKELNLNELNTISGGAVALEVNSHPIHEWTDAYPFSSEKVSRHNIRAPLQKNQNDLARNNLPDRLSGNKPQIKPCTFEGNHAPSSGGALKFD